MGIYEGKCRKDLAITEKVRWVEKANHWKGEKYRKGKYGEGEYRKGEMLWMKTSVTVEAMVSSLSNINYIAN